MLPDKAPLRGIDNPTTSRQKISTFPLCVFTHLPRATESYTAWDTVPVALVVQSLTQSYKVVFFALPPQDVPQAPSVASMDNPSPLLQSVLLSFGKITNVMDNL